jgi:PAS domain S-box-containing protein
VAAETPRLDQLSRLVVLGDALAGAFSPTDVAKAVLDDALTVFGADAGTLVVRDGDRLHVVGARGWDESLVDRFRSFSVDDELPLAQAVRTECTVTTASPTERDRSAPALAGLRTGYQATASIPLVSGGRVLGALGLAFRDGLPDDPQLVPLLEVLARQCAAALDRAEAFSRLDAERAQLRALVEQLPGGVIIAEAPSGRMVLANAEIERLLGHEFRPAGSVDEYVDNYEVLHADGRRFANDELPLARALRGEAVQEEDCQYRRGDGELVWLSVSARPVRDADGAVIAAVIWFHDVSARREAEEALRAESAAVETLHLVGQALVSHLDVESTLQATVDAAVTATGASFGAFFYNVVNEAGEALQLYTLSGAERAHFDQFGMPRNTRIFAPTFAGEAPVRSDDITADERYGHNAPHTGMPTGHLPVRSYLAVPVRSRTGDVLGGIFLGHPDPAVFGERDERIAVGIAAQAAVAIDNARLYEGEQRARRDAEAAADRVTRLQAVTAQLVDVRQLDDIVDTVVAVVGAASEARRVALYLVEGSTLTLRAAWGFDDSQQDGWSAVDGDGDSPAARVVRDRQPVFLEGPGDGRSTGPGTAADGQSPATALLPLLLEGRAVGVLGVGYGEARPFAAADRQFLQALAGQVAQAVDRVRLDEAEERARQAARDATARVAFLAEASRLLAGSLDYQTTLQALTGLVVPFVADAMSVCIVRDQTLELVASAHRDPAAQEVTRRVTETSLSQPGNQYQLALETGEPVFFPVIPDQVLVDAAGGDETRLAEMRAMAFTSGVLVPMQVADRPIGVLALVTTTASDRVLTEDDVRFVRELADRAALAVYNALTYHRERETAVTLQRSLLPQQLPTIGGVTVDATYSPGTEGTEIGGDWYDVIPLPGDRIGIVIGDVMGRGVRAAAVMGQLRATVRAYALEDHPPAVLVSHLDRIVQALEEGQLATCLYAVYDPLTRELRLTSAGHLPPLIATPDGEIRYLDVEPSLPLGIGGVEHPETVVVVPGGSTLLMYTDGLVESRTSSITEGMDALLQAVATVLPAGGPGMTDLLLRKLGRAEGHDDDTALLALTTPVAPDPRSGQRAAHMQLEHATTSVAMARAFVRELLGAWGLDHLTDTAVLLTSELVTNAVVHARSSVHVWVVLTSERQVRIDVVDSNPAPVAPRTAEPGAESGRGLHLVEELADGWGSEPTAAGKRVWFLLPV